MSGLQCIIVDVNGGWTLHHPKSKKGLRQGSALTTDTSGRLLKHSARPYRSSESSDDGLLHNKLVVRSIRHMQVIPRSLRRDHDTTKFGWYVR